MGTKLNLPGGGYIIVNNPVMLPGIAMTILDFQQKSDQFHCQLMEMGVKAYRCNDGWVNRDNHIVTFFEFERERGWYWGRTDLNKGDKIFLGNSTDGGQFAIIDGIANEGSRYTEYYYHLINDFIRFDKPKRKNLWSKIYAFTSKFIKSSMYR